jgi:hypothetical protein
MNKSTLFGLLAISSFSMCGADEDILIRLLPESFTISGNAETTIPESIDNPTVKKLECTCELIVEINRRKETHDTVFYYGFAGGKFVRRILSTNESGFSLEPDVFSEVIIKQYRQDSLILVFPPNINDQTPFYRDVAIIKGSVDAAGKAHGTWLCSPFNVDYGSGLTDFVGTAKGSWKTER